jgi:hypothetical protein
MVREFGRNKIIKATCDSHEMFVMYLLGVECWSRSYDCRIFDVLSITITPATIIIKIIVTIIRISCWKL